MHHAKTRGRLRRDWINVKEVLNKEGWTWKGKGPWVELGRCPFHGDHRPSFRGNIVTGRLRCMACGWSGDLIDYLTHRYRLSFRDACVRLGAWEVEASSFGSRGQV